MSARANRRPVALIILDGFGIAPPGPGNAVALASTPVLDDLLGSCPHTELAASGRDVGLPVGQMGNSEVGHLNIGAGRVVAQDLVRISAAASGGFRDNEPLVAACERARRAGRPLHLAGLLSDGGVHSHVDHLRAVVELATEREVERVLVHGFTDGRDVSPYQAGGLVEDLEREWAKGPAVFATLLGRIWAMDRDHRWERTEKAFDAIVRGAGVMTGNAAQALRASYEQGVTDEFVEPIVIAGSERIAPGDELVFINFRPDRARQICRALADPAFHEFDRGDFAPPAQLTAMTRYWSGQPGAVAFAERWPTGTLADVVSQAGFTQLHAAETEKYPHVTYFLNGGREEPLPGEDRFMVQSPKNVRTYDEAPAMSAGELSAGVAARIRRNRPDLVVVNFANPDMVGHSGSIPATIAACEAADRALGVVLEAIAETGGSALVTADHGNAEVMLTSEGAPQTAHTTSPVPLVLAAAEPGLSLRSGGRLADIAPTLLQLLGLSQPAAMSGRSLISEPVPAPE